ncbi:serine-rich adhesin for platelets-like [Physella acuta]|uniref:serine-rich adhesin for platelets-like n=1 Tax=Physella acuta TaxID=109671 RepID=UPI0027DD9CA4|nr:serine-rich adhesin for platelets-like [Physella acuta]XP_059159369.1 serine-rich adhesin for platelets-like [Physella acuta]
MYTCTFIIMASLVFFNCITSDAAATSPKTETTTKNTAITTTPPKATTKNLITNTNTPSTSSSTTLTSTTTTKPTTTTATSPKTTTTTMSTTNSTTAKSAPTSTTLSTTKLTASSPVTSSASTSTTSPTTSLKMTQPTPGNVNNAVSINIQEVMSECFCNLSLSLKCELSLNLTRANFAFKLNNTTNFQTGPNISGIYICEFTDLNSLAISNTSRNNCTLYNNSSKDVCSALDPNTALHLNNCSGNKSVTWNMNTFINIQFTGAVVELQVNNTETLCSGFFRNSQTSSSTDAGKIAGAVIGACVGIVLVVLLVIILLRFRRKRSRALKQHTSAPNNALAGFSNDTAYRNSDSDLKNYELISVDDDQYSKSRGYRAFQDNTDGDTNNTRYTNNRPGDYVQAGRGTGTDVITSETTPAVNNISVGQADKHPDDCEADDGYSTFNNEAKHDYSVLRYRVVETTNPYNVLLGEKQDPKYRDPIPQPRRYSDVSYEGMSPFTEPITNSDDTGVKEVDIIDLSKIKPDDYDYPVMVCDNKANEIDEDEYSTPLSVDNLVRNKERNATINPYIVSKTTQSAPTHLTITEPAPTHQTHTTTNTTGNEHASSQQPVEDESPTYYYTQHSLLKHLQV